MIELSDSACVALRAGFEVIPVDKATVLVRSPEIGVRVSVEGMGADALADILRSLDGSRMARALRDHGGRVERVVRELIARDIVRVAGPRAPEGEQASFMARDHDDPGACQSRLAASRVVVCGSAPLVRCVERDLSEAGVRQVDVIPGAWPAHPDESRARELGVAGGEPVRRGIDGRGAELIVACLASPRDVLAEHVSAAASSAGVAWLHLLVFGGVGIVGPLFVPDEGPCLQCLWSRELANWADPELTGLYYETISRRETPPIGHGGLPACSGLVSQWGALEATKYLARFTAPALLGALLRVDFAHPGAVVHRVLRLPRCRACSPMVRQPAVSGQLFAGAS